MNLLKHPLVCISTSTAVTTLYHLKCTSPSTSTRATREGVQQLWRARLVYYLLIGQSTLRGFLFVADSELLYDPLVAFTVFKYPVLSGPLLISLNLVSSWGICFDYAFNYNLDSVLAETYQLLVENGQHFRALNNGRQLEWPKLNNNNGKLWQLWRLPMAYIALGKSIWKLSGSTAAPNDRSAPLKFHTTQLGIFSSQLRGKLLVYTTACEALFIFLNLLGGK